MKLNNLLKFRSEGIEILSVLLGFVTTSMILNFLEYDKFSIYVFYLALFSIIISFCMELGQNYALSEIKEKETKVALVWGRYTIILLCIASVLFVGVDNKDLYIVSVTFFISMPVLINYGYIIGVLRAGNNNFKALLLSKLPVPITIILGIYLADQGFLELEILDVVILNILPLLFIAAILNYRLNKNEINSDKSYLSLFKYGLPTLTASIMNNLIYIIPELFFGLAVGALKIAMQFVSACSLLPLLTFYKNIPKLCRLLNEKNFKVEYEKITSKALWMFNILIFTSIPALYFYVQLFLNDVNFHDIILLYLCGYIMFLSRFLYGPAKSILSANRGSYFVVKTDLISMLASIITSILFYLSYEFSLFYFIILIAIFNFIARYIVKKYLLMLSVNE